MVVVVVMVVVMKMMRDTQSTERKQTEHRDIGTQRHRQTETESDTRHREPPKPQADKQRITNL